MRDAVTADALRSLEIFRELDEETAAAVAAALEPVSFAAEEVVIRQGDLGDSMFIVASGRLRVVHEPPDGPRVVVAHLGPGQHFGEINLFAGGRRSASVVADEDARALRLPRAALDALGDRAAAATAGLRALMRRRLLRSELGSLLPPIVGPLDADVLTELERRIAWVTVPRGEALFRQGEAGDAWYVIARGRLEVVIRDDRGEERAVRELGRGESLGEIALLTGEPRSASVYALRDTDLIRVGKAEFDEIMARYPRVLMSIAQTLTRRAVRAGGERSRARTTLNVAVIGASPGAPTAWLAERLARACGASTSTLHVSRERLAALGVIARTAPLDDPANPAWLRIGAWLDEEESRHEVNVLEEDPSSLEWTARAIRRADHVLLVADATRDPRPTAWEAEYFRGAGRRGPNASLVLVHPEGTQLPSGTSRWLEARSWIKAHHHVRRGDDAGVERVARLLTGRGVGLVLGGGGARGFAHLGVIAAMRRLGIPIDYIGGTSIGSIIAGQHAMGLDVARATELNRELARTKPFSEYTLPVVSIVRGRKVERSARTSFEDVRVEDLWIPYFCVSANLTHAQMVVHDRGLLREATRASGALPGILTPVVQGRALLVDGGVINNLPGDVMRERCGGAVIAVDVSPEEDVSMPHDAFPSPWRILLGRLWPFASRVTVPSIADILMRTLMLSSASRARRVRGDVDLYLRPSIDRFGMLEFHRIDEIVAAGYEHAMEALPAWKAAWERTTEPGR